MREATESRRYRCGRRGRSCPGSRHGHGRDRGTRTLPAEHGDEQAALDSVYKLFGVTRETIKRHGPGCRGFTKIAIVVLNQVIRPFTARWHRESLAGAFTDKARCKVFRRELDDLQDKLLRYTKMLGDMAGVEDLTELENG